MPFRYNKSLMQSSALRGAKKATEHPMSEGIGIAESYRLHGKHKGGLMGRRKKTLSK